VCPRPAGYDCGSAATTVVALHYGNPNWVPITGDWNGSGKTQVGVYRPSTQTCYLQEVTAPPASSPPPVVTTPVPTPLPPPTPGTPPTPG
jgi:hypothetical protein